MGSKSGDTPAKGGKISNFNIKHIIHHLLMLYFSLRYVINGYDMQWFDIGLIGIMIAGTALRLWRYLRIINSLRFLKKSRRESFLLLSLFTIQKELRTEFEQNIS